MKKLCSRQVHLDFHTSEHIPDVGARFNRARWQAALKAGGINSITVFAKCHHSWSYYPTRVGQPHPNLKCNLLKEQIEASHAIGVRAPIYFPIGWSSNDALQHPEWVVLVRDGTAQAQNVDPHARPDDPRPACSWTFLFPARTYLDLILAQTREICEQFDVDGFFYDICFGPLDYSPASCEDMRATGLDPDRLDDAREYHRRVWIEAMERCNAIIRERHPKATIFYNGSADMTQPAWSPHITHFEIENLPTTWGGYNKYPLQAKYFGRFGKPHLAVSGSFHTMWGEFGGFKHREAIRGEAAAMMMYGSRCSFGHQLHPSCEIELDTYRNLGHAYRYVRKIEPFCLDAEPFARLGLVLTGGPKVGVHGASTQVYDQGVADMLLEAQIDFEIATPGADWSRFETVILTGGRLPTPEWAESCKAFLAAGGSVLALNESPLDPEGKRFLLDIGASYVGPSRYENDYLQVGKELGRNLVESPFLNYTAGLRVKPRPGTRVLASIYEPWFNRTYSHYCSHQNTPNRLKPAPHPGAIQKGRVLYLAHPMGSIYHQYGARLHRDYFLNALRRLYRRPALTVQLPSGGRTVLMHQPQHRRYMVHLYYAPPMPRGECQVLEDFVPLYDVPVEVRVPETIRRAWLPLEKKRLTVARRNGIVALNVPKLQLHQIVVCEY